MPYAVVAQKLETLNDELLQEAYNYILYLHTKQEQTAVSKRMLGTLEGKMSANFADDWEISDEEMLGL